jgi:hypothetical protein
VSKQQGLQVFLTGAMGRWVFKDETNDGSRGKTNLVKVGILSSLSLLLSTQNSRASNYFLPELWEDWCSKMRPMMALEGKLIL